MTKTKYGVTGATGSLGGLIITELLNKVPSEQIIAIVRDADKAKDIAAKGIEVRVATYQQLNSLNTALAGVNKLLLISSSDLTSSRFEQHRNVIDAAKAASVESIAYTSILHADTTTNPLAPDHKATEEYLVASGLEYTFLRHGWYSENYIETMNTAKESGVVLTSAGSGKVNSASRGDYAFADVIAFIDETKNKIYELAGDDAWDFEELTATIAKIIGKDVTIQQVTSEEHINALEGFGLDSGTAHFVAAIDASIAQGALEDASGQLSKLIARPTTSLEDTLAKY